jgi:RNA polymerase sigma factor (sigma-70 family)
MGKYCQNNNFIEQFSLGIAEKIAVQTIARQTRGRLKLCRDNIDFVMDYIVRGYTLFNPNRGTKLQTYLISRARYAIKNLFRKKRKQQRKFVKVFSLDKPLVSGENFCGKHLIPANGPSIEEQFLAKEILEYIKNSNFFFERQKKILLAVFEENRNIQDIADELGLHKSYAHLLFNRAIEKLRWKFNEK